ncbi:hypothetical protein BACI_c12860 [Bacillus cereus biovar anthracis str. CI]|nr:hypothetical protein BACI_c12860 [Bacillus cereus biovar anthracis str. CI]
MSKPQYVYNGFTFPDSDIRKLTSGDLTYLSKEQLKIERNEIYVRHGHIFQSSLGIEKTSIIQES